MTNNYNQKIMTLSSAKGKIALIDTKYLEILTKRNFKYAWRQINIEGMEYLPLIINTSISKDYSKVYQINLAYPFTKDNIGMQYDEKYIILNNHNIFYTKEKSNEENYDIPIRFNNKNIKTLMQVKDQEKTMQYIFEKKDKIIKLYEDASNIKTERQMKKDSIHKLIKRIK